MLTTILTSFSGQMTLVLTGLAILSACNTKPDTMPQPHNPLHQTQWILTKINDKTIENEQPLSLNLGKGRLNGFAGCNRFSGRFTTSQDGVMTVTPPTVTRMSCLGDIGKLENEYLRTLAKVNLYATTHQGLILMSGDRKPLLKYTKVKEN